MSLCCPFRRHWQMNGTKPKTPDPIRVFMCFPKLTHKDSFIFICLGGLLLDTPNPFFPELWVRAVEEQEFIPLRVKGENDEIVSSDVKSLTPCWSISSRKQLQRAFRLAPPQKKHQDKTRSALNIAAKTGRGGQDACFGCLRKSRVQGLASGRGQEP